MQSIQLLQATSTVSSGVESTDISQMADEILSNWFISRNSGSYARVLAQLHFSQRATVTIRNDTRFWRTLGLAFYIDTAGGNYVISGDSMRPVYDTRGRLVDYVVDVPMRSALVGEAYNVTPGRFVKVDSPSGIPYLSYVSHVDNVKDGRKVENTSEFITRAQTAISVRNLINNRSIDAVLQDQFTDILSTLTIGMGEPEMLRDKRVEAGAHLELHVGGHYDTYVELPEMIQEDNGIVGGLFQRPDGKAMVFRDPHLTYPVTNGDHGKTFTSLGVQPGHILFVLSGISGCPRGYQIQSVEDHQLTVSEATPFTQASDELATNALEYSIGWLSPTFDQIEFVTSEYTRIAAVSVYSDLSAVTAGTSRRLSSPGMIYLSGKPILDILNVELTNPPTGNALIDATSGTIKFPNRTNLPPVIGSAVGTSQFQIQVLNPEKSQSAEAVVAVNVGYYDDQTVFDTYNLRVRYKTPSSFQSIHNYARLEYDRVLSANHLIRSRHPIWISAMIPIRYKPTVTASATFEDMQTTVANLINGFDMNDYLDMSDIMSALRSGYSQVGTVFPFELTYDLHMPDGQVVKFSTSDIVSIRVTSTNGVSLTNTDEIMVPTELAVPVSAGGPGITQISTGAELDEFFRHEGISDRTVVYKSRPDLITVYLRS
jgi:hypothetical protein